MKIVPFIKTFKTAKKYYFYDACINKIIELSKESYAYLNSHNIIDTEYNNEIHNLYSQGYLQKNPIKELRHPMTDFVEDIVSRKCNVLVLQITQNCNLRCKYCPYSQTGQKQRVHLNKDMAWEIAKKGLEFYHDKTLDIEYPCISFYGGEPLLNFSLIRKTINYCKKLFAGKKCMFSITTNGTLLSKEIISFFVENDFNLAISLDGDKEITDKNRKFVSLKGSVFDVVIKKLEYISKEYPDYMNKIELNMVLDQRTNMNGFLEVFNKWTFLKRCKISINTIEDDFLDVPINISKEFHEDFCYFKFLSYLNAVGRFNFHEDLYFWEQILKEDKNKRNSIEYQYSQVHECIAPSGPCIPGNSKIMIDIYGNIYPCEKLNEINSDYIIGTIKDGYDIEKIKSLINFSKITSERCMGCEFYRDCKLCVKCHSPYGLDSVKSKIKNCNECKNTLIDNLLVKMYMKEMSNWKEVIEE